MRSTVTRVFIGVALCAGVGALPGTAAAQTLTLYAYVANSLDNTVSVINTVDDLPVATIPVGTNPFAAVATPDGRHVTSPTIPAFR